MSSMSFFILMYVTPFTWCSPQLELILAPGVVPLSDLQPSLPGTPVEAYATTFSLLHCSAGPLFCVLFGPLGWLADVQFFLFSVFSFFWGLVLNVRLSSAASPCVFLSLFFLLLMEFELCVRLGLLSSVRKGHGLPLFILV